MTAIDDILTAGLLLVGGVFFLAGTVGLLRFPDVHSRLHAVTKADNLGLGFIILALIVQAGAPSTAIKLLTIWLLVLLSSSTACYLIGNYAAESSPSGREL